MKGCLELVASPRRTGSGGAFSFGAAAAARYAGAMSVVIYHNPRCGKSRQTLALLRERGIEPRIVEYLQTPPGPAELKKILAMLGMSAQELLRKKEAAAARID